MSAWALFYMFRRRSLDGRFFAMVTVAELLMGIQVIIGGVLYLTPGIAPGEMMHLLYGGLLVLALPFVHYQTRDKDDRDAALIWALAGIFMVGLLTRVSSTGVMGG